MGGLAAGATAIVVVVVIASAAVAAAAVAALATSPLKILEEYLLIPELPLLLLKNLTRLWTNRNQLFNQ
jgi:hypothetical protein